MKATTIGIVLAKNIFQLHGVDRHGKTPGIGVHDRPEYSEAKIWTLPAERMKAKQMHRVPLYLRAVEILMGLQGLHDELVFPSPRVQVPLSDMVLTTFLRWVKAPSSTPGRLATAHGFRSSFRDWCSEQGYARDLAERALAHSAKQGRSGVPSHRLARPTVAHDGCMGSVCIR
ncbi:tyrosine-type recombinase/integrase [Aeromonas jandaei]